MTNPPDPPEHAVTSPIDPCGNEDCGKCDPRPRWKISQHRVQHLTYTRKIYTRLPCRRVESDLYAAAARGHLGKVAHYTSLQKFLADPATTAILTSLVEQSAAPLNVIETGQYAIDSTGFSTAVYDRWFSQKHGKLCSQNAWVKLHIACGTVTHAVTSAVVTPRSDDSQLPELLALTRRHFDDVLPLVGLARVVGSPVLLAIRLPLDLDRNGLGHAAVLTHVAPPRDPEQDRMLVLAGAPAQLEVGTGAGGVLDVDQVALGGARLRGDRPAAADPPDLGCPGKLPSTLLARIAPRWFGCSRRSRHER